MFGRKPVKLLVCKRPKNFADLKTTITKHSARFSGQPLIFLFPEAAINGVHFRSDVKRHLSEVHEQLKRQGNAFVFLSVYERKPAKAEVTVDGKKGVREFPKLFNTGYIVLPKAEGKIHWIVRPKSAYRPGDVVTMEHIIQSGFQYRLSSAHWNKIAKRFAGKEPRFVKIGGRTFSHIVCADLADYPRHKSDVALVSADEIIGVLQSSPETLRPQGNRLILINDSTAGLKIIRSRKGKKLESDWIENAAQGKAVLERLKKKRGIDIEFI